MIISVALFAAAFSLSATIGAFAQESGEVTTVDLPTGSPIVCPSGYTYYDPDAPVSDVASSPPTAVPGHPPSDPDSPDSNSSSGHGGGVDSHPGSGEAEPGFPGEPNVTTRSVSVPEEWVEPATPIPATESVPGPISADDASVPPGCFPIVQSTSAPDSNGVPEPGSPNDFGPDVPEPAPGGEADSASQGEDNENVSGPGGEVGSEDSGAESHGLQLGVMTLLASVAVALSEWAI